ncbi:MAG: hypothetical protein NC033_00220 [Clostridiales bacterium]|nr:hypothetical protein [Clostridiales bacterium]
MKFMQFDTDGKIQEYIECAEALFTYDKLESIINCSKEDAKRSVALGKKLFSLAKQLFTNAPEDFICLLDSPNVAVAERTAECLYPLYPKKCSKIFHKYLLTLEHGLEKFRVKTIIEGLTEGQKFFTDYFKKFYGVDDLSTLNREK